MRLPPPFCRPPFLPKKSPKPQPTETGDNPEPKGGRFKVTIKPVLRDGNCEWWTKVDDNGEQVAYVSGYSKDQAERTARQTIKAIKEREKHELQPGTVYETN